MTGIFFAYLFEFAEVNPLLSGAVLLHVRDGAFMPSGGKGDLLSVELCVSVLLILAHLDIANMVSH